MKFFGLLSCFVLLLSGCGPSSGKVSQTVPGDSGYMRQTQRQPQQHQAQGAARQPSGLSSPQDRTGGMNLNLPGDEASLPEYSLLEIPAMPEMYTDYLVDVPLEEGMDMGEEAQVELVEIPKLPPDDGIPLTVEEKIALHSTGELDRHLSAEETREVELYFKYYLHEQRERFERYLARSEYYLPYVRRVFRDMGLPEEVAYLAIVESGFNSHAVSRAGAAGMWQFMPYTGKKFGLAQNSWIDERRDAFKATRAAGTYLLQLYEMFGDWHLAIAAYNAGEGKISRALQSTGASDFFELCRLNHNIPEYKRRLRTETKQYVPRLLAVTKIMRNLELLGMKAPDPDKALKVTALKLKPSTDLAGLARNSGMSWDDFKFINPSFRRTVSPPSAYATAYVDDFRAQRALAWLAKPESQRKYVASTTWQRYKVRKGDTLSSLSRRHGVSVAALKKANNMKGNTLLVGATIRVPVKKSVPAGSTTVASSSGKKIAAAPARSTSTHVVKKGDTMFAIAKKYGVSVADIQAANSISKKNTSVKIGQKLRIPGGKAAVAASGTGGKAAAQPKAKATSAKKNVYVVRKGDTLFSLAQKNNTNVNELMRINGLKRNKPIVPGQRIILPN